MPGQKTPIITIDGPAGAGKSTVAKRLAEKLDLSYLDTGAMYRALTLKAIRQDVDLENEEALVRLARRTTIDLEYDASVLKVFLDEEDVSEAIRSVDVTNKTFYVARAPRVRQIMAEWQRAIAKRKGVVVEGRDIGTVVFPQATWKFYLDADVQERCRRRIEELREKGNNVNADRLAAELKERDRQDQTRSAGPLKKAEDAVLIDATQLSVDEVVEEMLKYIKNHCRLN
ncbi:MAG: (d)CMP kinase [Candidatus Omnitrophica bacterium]|nr:(d)CMP kinase [Candidatus Omnitrophota bacterium]